MPYPTGQPVSFLTLLPATLSALIDSSLKDTDSAASYPAFYRSVRDAIKDRIETELLGESS